MLQYMRQKLARFTLNNDSTVKIYTIFVYICVCFFVQRVD